MDIGYDNPTNIANKITADFHSGTPSPQYPNLEFLNAEAYYEKPISFSGAGLPYDLYNLSVSNKNGAVNTTYAFPRPFSNPDVNLRYVSLYQTLMGVQNPFYYYWGSRLLSSKQQVKHNAYGNYLFSIGVFS